MGEIFPSNFMISFTMSAHGKAWEGVVEVFKAHCGVVDSTLTSQIRDAGFDSWLG